MSRLDGRWYEQAYIDPAQVASRGPCRYHSLLAHDNGHATPPPPALSPPVGAPKRFVMMSNLSRPHPKKGVSQCNVPSPRRELRAPMHTSPTMPPLADSFWTSRPPCPPLLDLGSLHGHNHTWVVAYSMRGSLKVDYLHRVPFNITEATSPSPPVVSGAVHCCCSPNPNRAEDLCPR
jgi:hypothetical protein